jgi:hypothetical protein
MNDSMPPITVRLRIALVAEGLMAAWALLNAFIASEMSAWVAIGAGAWAVLAAVACVITPRKRAAGALLSAMLQGAVAVLGATLLVVASDVPAMGGAYLLAGVVLLWAFLTERHHARVLP